MRKGGAEWRKERRQSQAFRSAITGTGWERPGMTRGADAKSGVAAGHGTGKSYACQGFNF
jgi:hypothetical protein